MKPIRIGSPRGQVEGVELLYNPETHTVVLQAWVGFDGRIQGIAMPIKEFWESMGMPTLDAQAEQDRAVGESLRVILDRAWAMHIEHIEYDDETMCWSIIASVGDDTELMDGIGETPTAALLALAAKIKETTNATLPSRPR